MHHYFHTQTHFIKTPWVKNVPLRVFAYFLKLSEDRYGEIPRGKVNSCLPGFRNVVTRLTGRR